MALAALLCSGLLVFFAFGQSQLPSSVLAPEVARLIQIKNQVRRSLQQLPNHTCRVDIRRAHLSAKAREKIEKRLEKFRKSAKDGSMSSDIPLDAADSIVLDVAVIDGKELYAFPDSDRFEERPLEAMVGHGTVSTGSFAGHARNIFVNDAGRIRYGGEETFNGRLAHRYDYDVELFRSGYSVVNEGRSAVVPYHGSFWAAADDDQLLRLTVEADDIPPYVRIDEFATQIDYQPLHLESMLFTVPARARLTMMLSDGVESINETTFTDCRSFVGSSTLSFDDDTVRFYAERVEELQPFDVPPGLLLLLRLSTALDSETAQVGTTVEAILARDIEYGDGDLLPKGALLRGRLRRFEHYPGGDEHYVVGIEFRELTFDQKRAIIELALVGVNAQGATHAPPGPASGSSFARGIGDIPGVTRETVDSYRGRAIPGVGVFYVRKKKFQLKPGLRMTWRTGSISSLENPEQ